MYDNLADFGCRTVGEVVHQENQMFVKEAYNINPGQDDVTFLPMGFTRPDIMSSYCYQNQKNALPPQFLGFEGLIKTPQNYSSADMYNFNFQLSNVSYDNSQDIIDHLQQTTSSNIPSQLSCLQSMEDKMIKSSENSSYQMTPVRTAQAEGKSCDKWKNIRRSYIKKKVPIRKAPQAVSDPVPERKRTAPINPAYTIRKSRIVKSVLMWPYRDRVIHLLALRDYKKSELLIRLQKDGINKSENDSLEKILYQVANLNTQTFSYSLKDCIFKEVQRDWPGYNEIDRQSLDLVLSRKVNPFQNVTDTEHPESSTTDDTLSSQDQLIKSADSYSLKRKKVRISHLTTAVQSKSMHHFNSNSEKSKPSADTAKHIRPPLPTTHLHLSNPPLHVNYNQDSYSTLERPGTYDPYVDCINQDTAVFDSQLNKQNSSKTLASNSFQMKYPNLVERKKLMCEENFQYKFTEQKANKQNYNIMMEKQKTDSKSHDEGANPKSNNEFQKECAASGKTCSTSGPPDYMNDYFTIVSFEQRQHYEQAFRKDCNEYQALRTKLLDLSRKFFILDSERKLLSPDSKEYQDINEKISLEYQKMKAFNPNFAEEKCRCLYLYNKIVHIKKLINDFDQQQAMP